MRFSYVIIIRSLLLIFILLQIPILIGNNKVIASHVCGYSAGDCGCELTYNQWSCVASTTRCFVDGGIQDPEWICATDPNVHSDDQTLCSLFCNQPCTIKGCPGGDWQRTCAITQGSQHCYGGGNTCNADVRLTACESMLNTNTCSERVVTDTRECWVGGANPNPTIVPGASPTPDPVPPPLVFPPSIKVIGVVFEDANNNGKFESGEKILGPMNKIGTVNYIYDTSPVKKIDCNGLAHPAYIQEANEGGLKIFPAGNQAANQVRCYGGYIEMRGGADEYGGDAKINSSIDCGVKWGNDCYATADCSCIEYNGIKCGPIDGTSDNCTWTDGRSNKDEKYKSRTNSFQVKLKDFGLGFGYIGSQSYTSPKTNVIPIWGPYNIHPVNDQLQIKIPSTYEITRAYLVSTNNADDPYNSTARARIVDNRKANTIGGFDSWTAGASAVVVWGIRTRRVTINAKAHLTSTGANCDQLKAGAALDGTSFSFIGTNGSEPAKTQTGGDYVSFTDLKPGGDTLLSTPPAADYESRGYCVYKNGNLQNSGNQPWVDAAINSSTSAGDTFTVEAGYIPTTATIKARAHIVTATAGCAAIKADTDYLDNTKFKFTPPSTNGAQAEQTQGTPPIDHYVTFSGLTPGTDTLDPTPPSTNYDPVRTCLYLNGTLVGAQSSVTTQKGDTAVFELGYNLNSNAWVQTQGGDVYADEINSFIPNPASPRVFSLRQDGYNGIISYKTSFDFDKNPSQDGRALAGQGNDWLVNESMPTVNYFDVFYQRLGSPKTADFQDPVAPLTQSQLPSQAASYLIEGNATLGGSPWVINGTENLIVIVKGDLTIDTPITFAVGAKPFAAFLASGDIKVTSNVGTTRASTTPVLEGIFVSGKTFFTGTSPTAGTGLRFVGKGSFVAKNFNLQRDLDIQGNNYNKDNAAELFIYNPGLVARMPQALLDYPVMWQEVEP